MRTELRIVHVISKSNVLNSCKTKSSSITLCHVLAEILNNMASNRSHAHLISTTHSEVSRIMKLAWVTYLGALSRINVILIPQISAPPPPPPPPQSWPSVTCTAHGPSFARVQYILARIGLTVGSLIWYVHILQTLTCANNNYSAVLTMSA